MTDIEIQPVPFHELGDIALVTRVGRKLDEHYPGWPWVSFIDDQPTGGVLVIMNQALNYYLRVPYGYYLHLTTVYADPDLKCVVKAGGEILERHNQARTRWKGQLPQIKADGVESKHQPFGAGAEDFIIV